MNIRYIDSVEIRDKRVLLRADFDVPLNSDSTISNDIRIKQNVPTISYLLQNKNKVICVAKLNRPHGRDRDPKHSLAVVVERLKQYLPNNKITLVNDFLTDDSSFRHQQPDEILVLENIRFYPEEKQNDSEFAKKLAALADVYVNDAFAMAHRTEASVVSVPQFLPSYGGLLLKKEVETISRSVSDPSKPVVIILGGAKISSKINLIEKMISLGDYLLVCGGIANTFLASQNIEVGQSIYEYDEKENARRMLYEARLKTTNIVLPIDVVCGDLNDLNKAGVVKKIGQVTREDNILDIGPETQRKWSEIIKTARTIIWNGPPGNFENAQFKKGTDAIYNAIVNAPDAISVVGGGDTLAAIAHNGDLEKITHISTGGGAMLEFIEKGTLPGLEALKRSSTF